MQILKFDGSSVADAENISRVIEIIKYNTNRKTVVVSALEGVTDLLLNCAAMAETGNEDYKIRLGEIEDHHMKTVKKLIPIQQQSSILSLVKKACNEMEDICSGIFILSECSFRTKDKM